MIQFIYGSSGSGKSTLVSRNILKDLESGTNAILLVPEQQAVEAEQRIADITGNLVTLNLEILNFTRLANRVFRTLGGLAYNYINSGAKSLIMWQVLSELSPMLTEYKNIRLSDKSFIKLMLHTVDELKAYNIYPSTLERAVEALDDSNIMLKNKLSDISLIYSSYKNLLHNQYDDPSDDLTRLADLLYDNDFFGKYNIYIDSFTGFTLQEFAILRYIFIQAENVTVTLCCDKKNEQELFKNVSRTDFMLHKIVTDNHLQVHKDIVLEKNLRFKNDELKFLEKNIWRLDTSENETYQNKIEHVSIIECNNMFSEAEAVAKDILQKIRHGERYRDIVITMRDTTRYNGIIDSVLDKYNIPYFMSVRTDITTKPLIKLILAAFSIQSGNWRKSDVISYIKTGLTDITVDECDILETYAMTWNINGRRWIDEYEWNMNPDGYTDIITESSQSTLIKVNQIRQKLITPLVKLFENIKAQHCTVKSVSEALFVFLTDLNIPKKLDEKAKYEHNIGNYTEEKELIQIWNILMNILDQLVFILSDLKTNAEEYSQLLSMILNETNIGKIPNTIDEVIIGNSSILRVGKAKSVYILGVNDGIFPKIVLDDNIFNDRDKETLEYIGIFMSPNSEQRTTEELFYFYNVATCVSDNLTIVYSVADLSGKAQKPSIAAERIKKLFPHLKVNIYSETKHIDLIEGFNASVEYAALYRTSTLGKVLLDIYKNNDEYKNLIASFDIPITQIDNKLSENTAKKLFSGNLSLTQSKLESYILCNFSFYCKHTLKLNEKKRATFKSADIGNFIHKILERFMSQIQTDNGIKTDLSDEEIEKLVDEIISDYIFLTCGALKDQNNRLFHLFARLRRTSLLLIKNLLNEFSQSEFIPSFFEMPIEFGNAEAITPLCIPMLDGTQAYIYGKIDRIDTYKKGNDVYIRVVDYKTGVKNFSLSDIELGLNMQMLLYLFSIWQNPSSMFKQKLNCSGDIIPAGVLYFSARSPELTLDNPQSAETVMEIANSTLTRKGLLLDDMDILTAMDKNLNGKYIPVKIKKDGSLHSNSSVASLEKFGSIMKSMGNTIRNIGTELKSGQVFVKPLKIQSQCDSCEYCKMKPICRK